MPPADSLHWVLLVKRHPCDWVMKTILLRTSGTEPESPSYWTLSVLLGYQRHPLLRWQYTWIRTLNYNKASPLLLHILTLQRGCHLDGEINMRFSLSEWALYYLATGAILRRFETTATQPVSSVRRHSASVGGQEHEFSLHLLVI
jgi:hypothetical protein